MKKDKVLFVCANNRIRSQIAAAFLRRLAGERFEAYSACLDPGPPNPLAIEAMLELGIDLPVSQPDDLSILLNGEELFSYLITVCDTGSLKRCPVFPAMSDASTGAFRTRILKGHGKTNLRQHGMFVTEFGPLLLSSSARRCKP